MLWRSIGSPTTPKFFTNDFMGLINSLWVETGPLEERRGSNLELVKEEGALESLKASFVLHMNSTKTRALIRIIVEKDGNVIVGKL
jgi:hypothetical protein